MADKLLALVGPGKGPRLCTKRMGELRIRLSAFSQGVVRVLFEGGQEERSEVCEFTTPPSPWIEVEYLGRDRGFIATIHSQR